MIARWDRNWLNCCWNEDGDGIRRMGCWRVCFTKEDAKVKNKTEGHRAAIEVEGKERIDDEIYKYMLMMWDDMASTVYNSTGFNICTVLVYNTSWKTTLIYSFFLLFFFSSYKTICLDIDM